LVDFWSEACFGQGSIHDLNPAITGVDIQLVWGMSHTQRRVATLFNVSLRPTEPTDQEASQSILSAFKIVRRIHWPQNVVVRYLPIKRRDQSLKSVFANDSKNIRFRNRLHRSCFLSSMIARYYHEPEFGWFPETKESAL
jgi:hypothetical protein